MFEPSRHPTKSTVQAIRLSLHFCQVTNKRVSVATSHTELIQQQSPYFTAWAGRFVFNVPLLQGFYVCNWVPQVAHLLDVANQWESTAGTHDGIQADMLTLRANQL
eukprot:4628287-Amphidinium_carterae.1